MTRIYIPLFLMTFFLLPSCQGQLPLNWDNYERIGKKDAMGLLSKDGELVLDTIYREIRITKEYAFDNFIITYQTKDKKRGIFSHQFKKLIEVGEEYQNIKYINSEKYFAFKRPEKNGYGFSWSGVMDKNGHIVLPDTYNTIYHDGKSLFFVTNYPDTRYTILNEQGEPISEKTYGTIGTKFGLSYASMGTNGDGDIWGPMYCLLDEAGKEMTEFEFQSLSVKKCASRGGLVYLHMRKSGKFGCYRIVDGVLLQEDCDDMCPD